MDAYAKRIGADFVAITKPTQDWWGLEKFRVLPFAQSYERTLYVDADVFLTEETSTRIFRACGDSSWSRAMRMDSMKSLDFVHWRGRRGTWNGIGLTFILHELILSRHAIHTARRCLSTEGSSIRKWRSYSNWVEHEHEWSAGV
jgi:hypothetical protein